MVVGVIQFIAVAVAIGLVLSGWLVGRRQKQRLAEEARASVEAEISRLQELLALERMRAHRDPDVAEPTSSESWIASMADHRMTRPGRQGTQPEIH